MEKIESRWRLRWITWGEIIIAKLLHIIYELDREWGS